MSKVMTITLPEDVYETLLERSKKMGLSKSAYIMYSLKGQFEKEDVIAQMPNITKLMEEINSKLPDKK